MKTVNIQVRWAAAHPGQDHRLTGVMMHPRPLLVAGSGTRLEVETFLAPRSLSIRSPVLFQKRRLKTQSGSRERTTEQAQAAGARTAPFSRVLQRYSRGAGGSVTVVARKRDDPARTARWSHRVHSGGCVVQLESSKITSVCRSHPGLRHVPRRITRRTLHETPNLLETARRNPVATSRQ